MAASMRALGIQCRKKQFSTRSFINRTGMWIPDSTPTTLHNMISKRSFSNRTGIWSALNAPATMDNMISKRSFGNTTGIWSPLSHTLMKFRHEKSLSFRLNARTTCNLGSLRSGMNNGKVEGISPKIIMRPIPTTTEKLPITTPRYMRITGLVEMFVIWLWKKIWKRLEDFSDRLGKFLTTGILLAVTWLTYHVLLALGLDTRILDKIKGEKVESEENDAAVQVFRELLEHKDRRMGLLLDEANKKVYEAEKKQQEYQKELKRLKATIQAMKERERRNKSTEGSGKQSEA